MSLNEREMGIILERLERLKELLVNIQKENVIRDTERRELMLLCENFKNDNKAFQKWIVNHDLEQDKFSSRTFTWVSIAISLASLTLVALTKLGVT